MSVGDLKSEQLFPDQIPQRWNDTYFEMLTVWEKSTEYARRVSFKDWLKNLKEDETELVAKREFLSNNIGTFKIRTELKLREGFPVGQMNAQKSS